jgi:anti-sigma factor RsiW
MAETAMIDTRQEWLDAYVEGTLDAANEGRVAAELAADPRLAAEKAGWQALHRVLHEDRVAVREGFQQRVMAALPEPAWRPAASRGVYPALVAALLACALGATFLLSGLADQPLAGTGLALADFLQTTLLAGSGIAAATFVGLGFGLEEMFAQSGASLFAFGVMVLCLNLLFFSLLRRRGAATAAARQSDGG